MKKLTTKEKQDILKKINNLKGAREDFYFNHTAFELNKICDIIYNNSDLSCCLDWNNIKIEDLKELNKLFRLFKRKVLTFKEIKLEDYEKGKNKYCLTYNIIEDNESVINLQLSIFNTLSKYARDRGLALYNITTYAAALAREIGMQYYLKEVSPEEEKEGRNGDHTVFCKAKAKSIENNFLYQKVKAIYGLCGLEYWLEEYKEEKQIKLDNIERTITYYENIIYENDKEEEAEK